MRTGRIVIYLDSSVAIAEILAEDRLPPAALWEEHLVASRLLQYEVWVRLHARGLGTVNAEPARELLGRISLMDLSPTVLARALEPFPMSLRTLDALHVASVVHLHESGRRVQLASYDRRMVAVARAMRIPLYELGA